MLVANNVSREHDATQDLGFFNNTLANLSDQMVDFDFDFVFRFVFESSHRENKWNFGMREANIFFFRSVPKRPEQVGRFFESLSQHMVNRVLDFRFEAMFFFKIEQNLMRKHLRSHKIWRLRFCKIVAFFFKHASKAKRWSGQMQLDHRTCAVALCKQFHGTRLFGQKCSDCMRTEQLFLALSKNKKSIYVNNCLPMIKLHRNLWLEGVKDML